MKTGNFFNFGSRLVSSTVQAHAIGLKKDEEGVENQWNLIKGKFKGIHFPIIFKHEYGEKLTDILDTGWPSLLLISDRMKMVLENSKLTGWITFPIRLLDKNENEVLGYHGFSITGSCAAINFEKSEIIEKRLVPTGPICKFYKGIFIELDKWDGSDFFTPEKSYAIYVTKRAADILKQNKITNMRLENVADMEVDVYDVKRKVTS